MLDLYFSALVVDGLGEVVALTVQEVVLLVEEVGLRGGEVG